MGAAQARSTRGQPAEIRRASPKDWQVVREVRLAALGDAPGAFASTLDRELGFRERTWRDRLSGDRVTFLAWRDGRAVGIASGLPDDPAEDDSVPGSWHLVSMWVDPDERGRGTAGALVDAVAVSARAAGAERLALWVTDVNARARAFYARLGFTATGRRQLVRPEDPDHWEQEQVLEFTRSYPAEAP